MRVARMMAALRASAPYMTVCKEASLSPLAVAEDLFADNLPVDDPFTSVGGN